jgi:hypothetical protein
VRRIFAKVLKGPSMDAIMEGMCAPDEDILDRPPKDGDILGAPNTSVTALDALYMSYTGFISSAKHTQ